eukprot:11692175-Alexandrium_andersonii.AAC.1
METELASKMDYWLRLPWVLCGCSHPDQTLARRAAASALEQYAVDARDAAHDPRTVALMKAGSEFRQGLEQFAAGGPLWHQNESFTRQVAAMRFFPVAETRIEEKHARVSLESKRHHVGPCRVSMSNRLLQMNTMLAKQPQLLTKLVEKFSEARALGKLASLLGLEGHPRLLALQGSRRKTHVFRATLTEVIYQCDIEARFTSLKQHMRADSNFKASRSLKTNRLDPGRVRLDECS